MYTYIGRENKRQMELGLDIDGVEPSSYVTQEWGPLQIRFNSCLNSFFLTD
jgi:hypothetical protein